MKNFQKQTVIDATDKVLVRHVDDIPLLIAEFFALGKTHEKSIVEVKIIAEK